MKRTDTRLILTAAVPLVALLAGSVPPKDADAASPNTFNRLMRPPSERNPPPPQDGIHDPASPGTALLQPPKDAFAPLPKGKSGNYVDWVQALEAGKIEPRFDPTDPSAKPILLDLNIVREVKGSMPDVVYPHKQHTEWLDCSNCHPAIFIPQRGANEISMASILLGEKCGVCHGKVAFPVAECRRCHSQKKGEVTGSGGDEASSASAQTAAAKP
jgi:c(7)-type cytochrome triheme protein